MTAAEMKAYFLAEYDAATSLSAPGWEDSEISTFLNIAQDTIVTELFRNKDLSRLGELINTATNLSTFPHPAGVTNGVFTNLSSVDNLGLVNFFFYVDSRTTITRTNPTMTSQQLPNELIDRDSAKKFYLTPYNKLWLKYPKVYIESLDSGDDIFPRLVILVDAYTTLPLLVDVTYLKRPVRISITGVTTTDLNESLHQTIVQLAVEQAVKSIKVAKISNQ